MMSPLYSGFLDTIKTSDLASTTAKILGAAAPAAARAEGAAGRVLTRAVPPPVPAAPRGLFAAPRSSPFSGNTPGPAPRIAPVAPLPRSSMQHSSFLARQPQGAAGLAESHLTANPVQTRARIMALGGDPMKAMHRVLEEETAHVKASQLKLARAFLRAVTH